MEPPAELPTERVLETNNGRFLLPTLKRNDDVQSFFEVDPSGFRERGSDLLIVRWIIENWIKSTHIVTLLESLLFASFCQQNVFRKLRSWSRSHWS